MGSALFLQLSTNTSQLVREQIFGYRHNTSLFVGAGVRCVCVCAAGQAKRREDDDDGAKETTK